MKPKTIQEWVQYLQSHSGVAPGKDANTSADPNDMNSAHRHYILQDGWQVEFITNPQNGEVTITSEVKPRLASSVSGSAAGETVSAPPNQKFIVTRLPDETLKIEPNANYTEPKADPSAGIITDANGNKRKEDPNKPGSYIPIPGIADKTDTSKYIKDANGNPYEPDPNNPGAYRPVQGLPQAQPKQPDTIDGMPVDAYNAQTSRRGQEANAAAQQASNLIEQAKMQLQASQDAITNAHAAGQLSLNASIAKANEMYQRIDAQLKQDLNAITQRGQDITARGQNIDFAGQLASSAMSGAAAQLPYMAPQGTAAMMAQAVNAAQTGQKFTMQPLSAPVAYDPTNLGMQLAAKVLAGISPAAAQMTGGQQGGGFQLPTVPPQVQTQRPLPPPVIG